LIRYPLLAEQASHCPEKQKLLFFLQTQGKLKSLLEKIFTEISAPSGGLHRKIGFFGLVYGSVPEGMRTI
jgi:hypothetical protein